MWFIDLFAQFPFVVSTVIGCTILVLLGWFVARFFIFALVTFFVVGAIYMAYQTDDERRNPPVSKIPKSSWYYTPSYSK